MPKLPNLPNLPKQPSSPVSSCSSTEREISKPTLTVKKIPAEIDLTGSDSRTFVEMSEKDSHEETSEFLSKHLSEDSLVMRERVIKNLGQFHIGGTLVEKKKKICQIFDSYQAFKDVAFILPEYPDFVDMFNSAIHDGKFRSHQYVRSRNQLFLSTMIYELQQCFAFMITCFEEKEDYSKNDGTFNSISSQISLFDDWMNKSTELAHADHDSSEDIPHRKKQATLQIKGPMGKGTLGIGPVCLSQAGSSPNPKKNPKKKKVKKETDTKEVMSRKVGTPVKAFGYSDNWEASKDYALTVFNEFTYHDAAVDYEEIKEDDKVKEYVVTWVKKKYVDINPVAFYNKGIWSYFSAFLMRVYIIPVGRKNAGERLNYKTILSRLAQMLNK